MTMTRPENLSAGSLSFVISYRGRRAQNSHPRKAATISMFPMHAHGVRLKSSGGTKLKIYNSASDVDCTEAEGTGGDHSIYICILAYASKRLALR